MRRTIKQFASDQFWGGHPNTFRTFYAWASLSLGVFMFMHEEAFNSRGFALMQVALPLQAWAVLFIAHWALLSLVVMRRSAVGIQFAVNAYGFCIWTAYVVLQDISLGYFALNSSMERVAVLYSVWAVLRTGMNRRTDRP